MKTDDIEKLGEELAHYIIENGLVSAEEKNLVVWSGLANYKLGNFLCEKTDLIEDKLRETIVAANNLIIENTKLKSQNEELKKKIRYRGYVDNIDYILTHDAELPEIKTYGIPAGQPIIFWLDENKEDE